MQALPIAHDIPLQQFNTFAIPARARRYLRVEDPAQLQALAADPVLAALPRLALRDTPASHYHIRKAHAPDQLSSFEAAAYALTALEDDGAAALAQLLDAFDSFVAQQLALAAGAPDSN